MIDTLRLVEIEIHSYCNRTCHWCPNRDINRDFAETMPDEMYDSILNQLRSGGFKGAISYSRYNEPMSDIYLLKRRTIKAKEVLPDVKLVMNTNGDFLSRQNLEGLIVDELTIMDYNSAGVYVMKDRLSKIGVEHLHVDRYFVRGRFKQIDVLAFADWPKYAKIEDRGGILSEHSTTKRTKPCYEPKYFVAIDYNGKVTPCCHIRSDCDKHKEYVLGDLNTNTLEEILTSTKAIDFRNSTSEGLFEGPCKYCQKEEGRYTRENPGINY